MKRLIGLAGVGLVLAALVAGCGGSDDGDRMSRSEFIAKGNAICQKGSREIEAFAQGLGRRPSEQEVQDFATDTVIPLTERQIADLQKLSPPKDDEEEFEAFLAAARSSLDKVKADPQLLVAGGPDPFAEPKRLAHDYGLASCSA